MKFKFSLSLVILLVLLVVHGLSRMPLGGSGKTLTPTHSMPRESLERYPHMAPQGGSGKT